MKPTKENMRKFGEPLSLLEETDYCVDLGLSLHGIWKCNSHSNQKPKHIICNGKEDNVIIRMKHLIIDPIFGRVGFICGYDKDVIHILDLSMIKYIRISRNKSVE
ncbi:hypothetical protein MUP95_00310 [bacterium]|nr:hypothetical protein [bacterium]